MSYETQQRTSGSVARQVLILVGIVIAVVVGVSAASWATRSTDRATETIDESFSKVELDVSAGRVEIIGSDTDETTLESRTQSGWFQDAKVTHEVDGDTLRITGDCSSRFWFSFCATDVTLTVPSDVEVVADSSAGSVTARGLEGTTNLESSAGSVRVEDQSGRLTAHSSAGQVIVDGLRSDTAKITSSAGAVEVNAAVAPRSLDAESSAGRVTVTLPSDATYDVDADTSAGDTTVDVTTDPSSEHKVRAFSSAGAVTVTSD
ncbi:MAG TPA: DUF4097 family beta strand repeat-containing protein [Jiangellaceae bacterium]